MASRESSENHSNETDPEGFPKNGAPLYVKYRDHVFFKNCSPDEIEFCVREVIGWLVGEDSETLLICVDQPVDTLLQERFPSTGIVVLKDCILETHKVKIKKPFNCTRRIYSGHNEPYTKRK